MLPPAQKPFVYLASASPRRRELLSQIGVAWELLPAKVDESSRQGEEAAAYVTRLALAKAHDAQSRLSTRRPAPVLAADTAVVVRGQILGKPVDEAAGRQMLGMLSAAVHEVFSAVAVISAGRESTALSRTEVIFRELSEEELHAYWMTGEPADKAGAYGIQGRAAIFIREIRGSYSGVMGLPLFETAELLAMHGVQPLSLTRHSA